MIPQYKVVTVETNSEVAKGIYKMTVKNTLAGDIKSMKPGQFYMLRGWNQEPLLSRPISICTYDKDTLTFLYAVAGKGTELFSRLESGDRIEVMGPLGNGFSAENIKGKVAVVSGGIGVAPMIQLVRELENCSIDFYAGFRNEAYMLDGIGDFVNSINISTENGSVGSRGYVTELLDVKKYDMVLCCGPEIMMMKVLKMCREAGIPCYVSMEKHMACGVGACLVCTCKTKDGFKRTCKNGPVFNGDELELA